jgi:hypothetical protein
VKAFFLTWYFLFRYATKTYSREDCESGNRLLMRHKALREVISMRRFRLIFFLLCLSSLSKHSKVFFRPFWLRYSRMRARDKSVIVYSFSFFISAVKKIIKGEEGSYRMDK